MNSKSALNFTAKIFSPHATPKFFLKPIFTPFSFHIHLSVDFLIAANQFFHLAV
jgi:hypothetical protein